MLLTIRQYTLLFTILIIILVSAFAYNINYNLKLARANILASQQESAASEIEHAIAASMENIRTSAEELSQWQEVKQQISNPEIFAYWYNVRLRRAAFDLQKFTLDLMIYDNNGRALTILDDNTLPYQISTDNISDFTLVITGHNNIVYITPVYSEEDPGTVIGYLSSRLQLLPLILSQSQFQHIIPESLALDSDYIGSMLPALTSEHFSYQLRKAEGFQILEKQMEYAILKLIVIIIVPAIILYIAMAFIVGIPIQEIDNYIHRLRTQADKAEHPENRGFFQVRELNSVHDSLVQYHNELSQKEEYLSLTLNSIGDAVITADAERRVIRMNPVAEQLTGWSFEDARLQPIDRIFNIINATGRQPVSNSFDQVIKSGETLHLTKNTILISRDGSEYHIADSAAPLRDDNGDILGMVLVFSDITEQKMKDEQLQHSMKMDALGKLTGGIAHDFNNLLGVILGYSELLIDQLDDQSNQKRYADNIYQAGERARKLTSKLLTFSRKLPSEASPCNINELLTSERNILEKALTARVELVYQLEQDSWPVYLDPNQLRDAILNICINAMQAMPDGGTITISARNVHIEAVDKPLIDLDSGDYLQLSIDDTGIGMDAETRQRIFDPFFTTKGNAGTGLGMSQVYGFVQQAGGTIHVYSEPGLGTRITLYFPRYRNRDEDSSLQLREPSPAPASAGSETVLVVDDEPALLELSCRILDSHGYTTLAASNADQALAILETRTPDLLLTDVIMPGLDGYQLADIVRQKYPGIKIQLMSGFSDSLNRESRDPSEYGRHLQKPFSSAQLLCQLRAVLDDDKA